MSDVPGSDAGREAPAEATTSIGARLEAARTRRSLTRERVAEQLRLDVDVIAALEGDDAGRLPAPIFVQGYLRSYARLLELPEQELLSEFNRQGIAPPPLTVKRVDSGTPVMALPSFRLIRNIVLVLLAGLLIWLAWPLVDRVLEMRVEPAGEQSPGQLAIPPAQR